MAQIHILKLSLDISEKISFPFTLCAQNMKRRNLNVFGVVHNFLSFCFSFFFSSTDVSLSKEPKGDVSSQIAGKTMSQTTAYFIDNNGLEMSRSCTVYFVALISALTAARTEQ